MMPRSIPGSPVSAPMILVRDARFVRNTTQRSISGRSTPMLSTPLDSRSGNPTPAWNTTCRSMFSENAATGSMLYGFLVPSTMACTCPDRYLRQSLTRSPSVRRATSIPAATEDVMSFRSILA